MGKEQELRGRHVAEPKVPQSVVDDSEDRHRNVFDLERDDHEWRNTWRYKHDHVQSHWAGWRDCYLYAARRSSSDEAEVVAWHWWAKDKMSTWPVWSLGVDRPKNAPPDAVALVVAAPSGVKAGVTEAMVTRACEEAGWVVDPAAFEADPAEANRITSAYRAGMADILTAAFGVGDEGMGEGWKDWPGGDCPLPDPMVEYRRRDGVTGDGNASSLIGWVHFDRGSDIVAYRLLPTPPIQGDAK